MSITPTPLFRQFAQLLSAMNNCRKSENDIFLSIHEESLITLADDFLPSGSGIDNGVEFNFSESTPEKLVFEFGYHHMNEDGYYTHWSCWKMTITPSLQFEYDMDIVSTSKDQSDDSIIDYLHDTFDHALSAMVWQSKDSQWHSSLFESAPTV